MSYPTRNLKQKAVYWGNPQQKGFGGFVFDDPVEIRVRWENRVEVYLDSTGNKAIAQSVVYLTQRVDVTGYLYLGELSEIGSAEEGNPEIVEGAFRILGYQKIPNLKATAFERKAWLWHKQG